MFIGHKRTDWQTNKQSIAMSEFFLLFHLRFELSYVFKYNMYIRKLSYVFTYNMYIRKLSYVFTYNMYIRKLSYVFTYNMYIRKNINTTGTVSLISSEPQCKDGNVRFTTVPWKPFSGQKCGRYCRLISFKRVHFW